MDTNITPATPPAGNAGVADAIKAGVPATDAKVNDTKVESTSKDTAKQATPDTKGLSKAEAEVIRKIKVGDTEYDETTLASMIEKSKGADKKFLEAAKARKEALRFFKMAKENPREFLEKTGLDPKKFAYDEVAKDLQNKLRDPKEVELEEAQKKLKEYEAKEADTKAKLAAEKSEREAKALEQKFHSEIIEAMEAYPELPKNGHTVAQLARAIDVVRQKTGILLTAKEVAPQVVADVRATVKGVIAKASPEQIIAMLGEEAMAAIRKYDLAKLKNPLQNGSSTTTDTSEKPKSPKWKNSRDFWKTIDKAAKEERGQ